MESETKTNIYKQSIAKRELHITYPPYSDVKKVPNTYFDPLSMRRWLTAIANQLIVSPRISLISMGDDNLESARGARFQVNSVHE